MRSAYIIRRILALIPTLLLIYTLTFFLMHSTPGGPWDTGEKPIPADVQERLKAAYGLDKPFWQQYIGLPRQGGPGRSWPVLHPALAIGH